jgi:hypothetical protein
LSSLSAVVPSGPNLVCCGPLFYFFVVDFVLGFVVRWLCSLAAGPVGEGDLGVSIVETTHSMPSGLILPFPALAVVIVLSSLVLLCSWPGPVLLFLFWLLWLVQPFVLSTRPVWVYFMYV